MPYATMRAGDFRLIEFYDGRPTELYDLRRDPSEQRDLAAAQPEKVRALRTRLAAWRQDVGAQMPSPNPAYDPAQPEHQPTARQSKRAKKS